MDNNTVNKTQQVRGSARIQPAYYILKQYIKRLTH